MARNLVSPGLSFGEIDLSQVAQITALMGPAFVGTTKSGPAFEPKTISNYSTEFVPIYGGLDSAHYVPYATKFYLQYGDNSTVSRVLGSNATAQSKDEGFVVPASASWADVIAGPAGSGSTTAESTGLVPIAVLRERAGQTVSSITVSAAVVNAEMTWTVNVTGDGSGTYRFNVDNIEAYFSRDPNNIPGTPSCTSLYLDVFYYSQAIAGNADPVPSMSDLVYYAMALQTPNKLETTDVQGAYSAARTPWIVGAPTIDETVPQLFRFHALSDGDASNDDAKVSLDNIRRNLDSFGNAFFTFDVLIRKVNDTDKSLTIYERFSSCNLLPDSPNYIVKLIGDTNKTFNSVTNKIDTEGTWPNRSKFVRIEMATSVPTNSRPSGFEAPETVNNSDDSINTYPFRSWKVNQTSGSQLYNKNMFLGYEGAAYGAGSILYGPTEGEAGQDKGILLYDGGNWSTSATEITAVQGSLSASYLLIPIFSSKANYEAAVNAQDGPIGGGVNFKFTVPMFGGRDGYKKSLEGSDLVASLSAEYAYAINLLSDQDLYDFNMLAVPGTIANQTAHASIIETAIDMVETRGDAIYIADMFASTATDPSTPDDTSIEAYDSSYAATYWPWIKIYDNENEDYQWVPSSVLLIAQLAYNDKVAYPWYAPAGINRGHIANAVATRYSLNQDDRDTLYEDRINPIATFRNEGIVVWGQKTLQKNATALDRVNVRRLLVYAKKLIARIGTSLLFEPNNSTTWNKFTERVNPILADIASNNGLESFKVIMNASTNTPDRIDRNEMYGQIVIIPTKTVEALMVDFIINSSGVEFGE